MVVNIWCGPAILTSLAKKKNNKYKNVYKNFFFFVENVYQFFHLIEIRHKQKTNT